MKILWIVRQDLSCYVFFTSNAFYREKQCSSNMLFLTQPGVKQVNSMLTFIEDVCFIYWTLPSFGPFRVFKTLVNYWELLSTRGHSLDNWMIQLTKLPSNRKSKRRCEKIVHLVSKIAPTPNYLTFLSLAKEALKSRKRSDLALNWKL